MYNHVPNEIKDHNMFSPIKRLTKAVGDSLGLTTDRALLFKAVMAKDLDEVRKLLSENITLLEEKNSVGNTALHLAVTFRYFEIVEILLAHNAKINVVNSSGENALDFAVDSSLEILKALLLHIAGLPQYDQSMCLWRLSNQNNGFYPNVLFFSIVNYPQFFDDLFIKVLTQPEHSQQEIFSTRNSRSSLLHEIIRAGSFENLKSLLALNFDIRALDVSGNTILHWAVLFAEVEVITYILETDNTLLHQTNFLNQTALHFALKQLRGIEVINLLLQQNIDLSAVSNHDETKDCTALAIAVGEYQACISPILKGVSGLRYGEQVKILRNLKHYECYHEVLWTYAINLDYPQAEELNKKLKDLHLNRHLGKIKKLWVVTLEKSEHNAKYKSAAEAAEKLLINCILAKAVFIEDDNEVAAKFNTLKATCKKAIEEARPILGQHQEWLPVLGKFLLALLTFPISLPLYACGFFSFKTESEQFLDTMKEELDLNFIIENGKRVLIL